MGRYLATVAIAAASIGVLIAAPLFALLQDWGFMEGGAKVLFWPATAGFFYLLFHKLFNGWAWRSGIGRKFFGIPDVSGRYSCEGKTLENGAVKYEWNATVDVFQTWEKIRVKLKTSQSSSKSKIASISKESDGSFLLLYSFANEPRVGETDLNPHLGFCEMTFDGEGRAEGEYYNVKGRGSAGVMLWVKEDVTDGN